MTGQRTDAGAPLSPRERAVLIRVARGQDNPRIAAEMYVSVDTVKTHLRRVYQKLGVSDRAGAVVRAITVGDLPCPCPGHRAARDDDGRVVA